MKKELYTFLSLFLFLAIGMHFSAWISAPFEQIQALQNSPLGLFHPLYITFIVYLFVLMVKGFLYLIKKFFTKS